MILVGKYLFKVNDKDAGRTCIDSDVVSFLLILTGFWPEGTDSEQNNSYSKIISRLLIMIHLEDHLGFKLFCVILHLNETSTTYSYTAKNTVISPNFLMWKFCGKSQFPRFLGNCGNCAFPQNFHRKLGEITVFFTVVLPYENSK